MTPLSEIEQALQVVETAARTGSLSEAHLARLDALRALIPKERRVLTGVFTHDGRDLLKTPFPDHSKSAEVPESIRSCPAELLTLANKAVDNSRDLSRFQSEIHQQLGAGWTVQVLEGIEDPDTYRNDFVLSNETSVFSQAFFVSNASSQIGWFVPNESMVTRHRSVFNANGKPADGKDGLSPSDRFKVIHQLPSGRLEGSRFVMSGKGSCEPQR